jgi:hypothetical protein
MNNIKLNQSRGDLAFQSLGPLMDMMDRHDALDEAAFAAMEAAIALIQAGDEQSGRDDFAGIEMLREALASARAAAGAAAFALTTSADAARCSAESNQKIRSGTCESQEKRAKSGRT